MYKVVLLVQGGRRRRERNEKEAQKKCQPSLPDQVKGSLAGEGEGRKEGHLTRGKKKKLHFRGKKKEGEKYLLPTGCR